MSGWLFGIGCWLGFNALVVLFAWASCRRRELDRSAHEAAMRRHPAGRRREGQCDACRAFHEPPYGDACRLIALGVIDHRRDGAA